MQSWQQIEPYVLPFFGLTMVVAGIVALKRDKKARAQWNMFAQTYGLTYTPPKIEGTPILRDFVAIQTRGEIAGELDGMQFRLFVRISGAGKNRRIFTVMSLAVPGMPQGLTIYQNNAFLKLKKAFGAQDIKTGDAVFDETFIVKGSNVDEVRGWLNHERRQALMDTLRTNRDLEISEGCVRFDRSGLCDNITVLTEVLQTMRDLTPHLR